MRRRICLKIYIGKEVLKMSKKDIELLYFGHMLYFASLYPPLMGSPASSGIFTPENKKVPLFTFCQVESGIISHYRSFTAAAGHLSFR